jgi:hypothetical protein
MQIRRLPFSATVSLACRSRPAGKLPDELADILLDASVWAVVLWTQRLEGCEAGLFIMTESKAKKPSISVPLRRRGALRYRSCRCAGCH